MGDAAKTTPQQARDLIENDPDVGSGVRYAVSVLEEAAMREAYERCAKIAETWADPEFASHAPGATGCSASFNEGLACSATSGIAGRIREGAPTKPALAWTREPPTVPGWYWIKSEAVEPWVTRLWGHATNELVFDGAEGGPYLVSAAGKLWENVEWWPVPVQEPPA